LQRGQLLNFDQFFAAQRQMSRNTERVIAKRNIKRSIEGERRRFHGGPDPAAQDPTDPEGTQLKTINHLTYFCNNFLKEHALEQHFEVELRHVTDSIYIMFINQSLKDSEAVAGNAIIINLNYWEIFYSATT
jgi:hypothetical protein